MECWILFKCILKKSRQKLVLNYTKTGSYFYLLSFTLVIFHILTKLICYHHVLETNLNGKIRSHYYFVFEMNFRLLQNLEVEWAKYFTILNTKTKTIINNYIINNYIILVAVNEI